MTTIEAIEKLANCVEKNAESIQVIQKAIIDLESHVIGLMGLGSSAKPGEAMVRFSLDSKSIEEIRQQPVNQNVSQQHSP